MSHRPTGRLLGGLALGLLLGLAGGWLAGLLRAPRQSRPTGAVAGPVGEGA